jgi:hypothetical protein
MKTRTTFILSLAAILTLAAGSTFGKYSGGTVEPQLRKNENKTK